MKKLRKSNRVRRRKRTYRPSFILGIMFDLWALVCLVVKIGAWPVRTLSHTIHRELRKYPMLRFRHAHVALCMAIGFLLVLASFALQNLFHHVMWDCTLETVRAAGVCPIWDAVSGISKVYSELAE